MTEVNPYASPRGVGGCDDRPPPVIGVWRDGRLLVMHKDAELPRFCIHTGEPAVGGRDYVLVWKAPGHFFARQKNVLIPLCRKCINDYLKLRRRLLAAVVLAVIAVVLIIAFPALPDFVRARPLLTVGCAVAAGVMAIGIWLQAYWTYGKPLSVVGSWGDYLWLRDVHRDYLARLPEWKAEA